MRISQLIDSITTSKINVFVELVLESKKFLLYLNSLSTFQFSLFDSSFSIRVCMCILFLWAGTILPPCDSNPCQNGASCLDNGTAYYCDCAFTGFTGNSCEISTVTFFTSHQMYLNSVYSFLHI